jgi:GTP-binding protein
MKFVDYVTISARSGHGGPGALSFRRAKFEPKGGPDGGDGGKGGSVILRGDPQLYTLLDLRYNRHHYADNGERGAGAMKTGKNGVDIILRVPLGTMIKDTHTDEIIGEVVDPDQEIVIVQGGRGGKGNTFFKSSTNRAPRHHQPGEPGEERDITLELKLMADVGLVGFPNAGKSTLVAAISAARPKVADYPFTTLVPSLGVVGIGDYQSFVIADIPGIIEGAHEGKGLGLQFLRHMERNAVLLFMVPITEEDPAASYETLVNELKAFNPELLAKPRMVALSKLDLVPTDERDQRVREWADAFPDTVSVFAISSVARFGLEKLKHELWTRINSTRDVI